MMGHKQKLNSGDEYDVVSRWRKLLCYCQRAGVTSKIKRKLNRRDRQQAKLELIKEQNDD